MQIPYLESVRPQLRQEANQIGKNYGLVSAAFGLLQIVVSTLTAQGHVAVILITQHQLQDVQQYGHLSSNPQIDLLFIPILMSIGTCLATGIATLMLTHYAARETALLTGDPALGRRAGIITVAFGTLAWIVLAILIALLIGNDGTLLASDPTSKIPLLQQNIGITIYVGIRAIILGGVNLLIALLFSSSGAQAGLRKLRTR